MKVLVTGGAGFLGRHLVRKLLDEGNEVTVVDLRGFEDDRFSDEPVTVLEGDVSDEDFMLSALQDTDIVVHAAAALPIQSRRQIRQTDYEGTRVALATAKANNVDRFIYVSTTAVYGIHDTPFPIDENFPKDPVGPYGLAKYKAELECLDYQDDMFVSIVRPKTFVGPERLGIMEVLFDWIRRGKNVYLLGDGTNKYQLLDVADLCEAIWLACVHPEADDIFNIGATNYGSINEDMQPVLDEADTGAELVHLPARPVQWILRILETLNLSPIVQWQYGTMDKNLSVDPAKARRTLGWKPDYSNQEALLRNWHWYEKNHDNLNRNSGVTHREPWNQKILKLVRWFS
ncbi:MAG: NAD-dependent epimerase/dehydratase family protein [bacterium]